MNRDELKDVIVKALRSIAPEVDVADLEMDEDLRDQVDLDSMDYLAFLTKVAKELDIKIAERDYPKLQTLDDMLEFLEKAL